MGVNHLGASRSVCRAVATRARSRPGKAGRRVLGNLERSGLEIRASTSSCASQFGTPNPLVFRSRASGPIGCLRSHLVELPGELNRTTPGLRRVRAKHVGLLHAASAAIGSCLSKRRNPAPDRDCTEERRLHGALSELVAQLAPPRPVFRGRSATTCDRRPYGRRRADVSPDL